MDGLPRDWKLKEGVSLYDWQKRALEAFPADHRGVAKIVTGAGKTLFAIALFVRFQNTVGARFKVMVVVSSKILQSQWKSEILRWTNVRPSEIGLMGNGKFDDLAGKRVVIAVVNSVLRNVDALNAKLNADSDLFLILDECHHYVGRCYSRILAVKSIARLGLSATPQAESYWPLEIVGDNRRIGHLFFELPYREAVRQGCVSEFELVHVGFGLSRQSRLHYDVVSTEIERCKHDASQLVLRHVKRRWDVLYGDPDRDVYATSVISELLKIRPSARILAFHERIASIDDFVERLKNIGIAARSVHSQNNDGANQVNIDAFRSGAVRVLVAGKALMEGFDMPSVDIGVIISATTSPVRAIQTIGRVLRKKDGQHKASIYRLFAADTVEEKVFERVDFAEIAGQSRNRFCRLEKRSGGCVVLSEDSDRRIIDHQANVDRGQLFVGDIVKGRPVGFYFSQLSNGRFVAAKKDKQYEIVDQIGMRRLYRHNPVLKCGTWYFCTASGCVLERVQNNERFDVWRNCGTLSTRFVMQAKKLA